MEQSELEATRAARISIVFSTGSQQIRVETLAHSLSHFSDFMHKSLQVLTDDQSIVIRANPPIAGSFVIDFDLQSLSPAVATLMSQEGIVTAQNFIKFVKGMFTLTKMFQGKRIPADSIVINIDNSVKVHGDGNTVTLDRHTVDVYNHNNELGAIVKKVTQPLDRDVEVSSFEIRSPVGVSDIDELPDVSMNRDDFRAVLANIEIDRNTSIERNYILRVNLVIAGLVFDSRFVYRDHFIKAKLDDHDFQDRINQGEVFSIGDVLEVDLNTRQVFDDTLNSWIDRSYTVLKVHDHRPNATQDRLLP